MRLIFTTGDKVKILEDWKDWKAGETAEVDDAMYYSITGHQILTLKTDQPHDFCQLYDYQVESIEPIPEFSPKELFYENRRLKQLLEKVSEKNTELHKTIKSVQSDPWQLGEGEGVYHLKHDENGGREVKQLFNAREYSALLEEMALQSASSNVHQNYESFGSRVLGALRRADRDRINIINELKAFQEDVRVLLRAIALQMEVFANGGTHHEKDVLASGLIRLIESALQKIMDKRENFVDFWWQRPDVFRSEYPVRRYQERLAQQKQEIEGLKKQLIKTGIIQKDAQEF